jgi:N6-adenosine-specific RNA methylase IME4
MKFRAILCDPPWRFATYSAKGKGRSAEAHYDCMSFDSLKALPVPKFAAIDCALFLWVTDPLLPKGLELISAWGFTYKTVGFYWVKLNKKSPTFFTGMGYWTRANPEMCLLATRGQPERKSRAVPRLVPRQEEAQEGDCIVAPRREHSRKPSEIARRIERLVPGPYLELFARESREGWASWGDETGLFDEGPVETRRFPSNLA